MRLDPARRGRLARARVGDKEAPRLQRVWISSGGRNCIPIIGKPYKRPGVRQTRSAASFLRRDEGEDIDETLFWSMALQSRFLLARPNAQALRKAGSEVYTPTMTGLVDAYIS